MDAARSSLGVSGTDPSVSGAPVVIGQLLARQQGECHEHEHRRKSHSNYRVRAAASGKAPHGTSQDLERLSYLEHAEKDRLDAIVKD
jgi:hypothetical protein